MSPTAKTVTVFIIVLAVAAGVYYWYANRPGTLMGGYNNIGMGDAYPLPSGKSTDDTALQADLSSIDAELSGLDADTSAVDTSLSDQPVPQSSL